MEVALVGSRSQVARRCRTRSGTSDRRSCLLACRSLDLLGSCQLVRGERDRTRRTIVVLLGDNMRKLFLGLLVQANVCEEEGIVLFGRGGDGGIEKLRCSR